MLRYFELFKHIRCITTNIYDHRLKSNKFIGGNRKSKINEMILTYQTELTKKEWPIIKFTKSILQVLKGRAWFKSPF